MTYKAKAAVSPEDRTKHATQGQCHVKILNIKPDGTKRISKASKG
jgi:hypothetical protein